MFVFRLYINGAKLRRFVEVERANTQPNPGTEEQVRNDAILLSIGVLFLKYLVAMTNDRLPRQAQDKTQGAPMF